MATDSAREGRPAPLPGNCGELTVLGPLVHAVRAGESRVLAVRGKPGAGQDGTAGIGGRARAGMPVLSAARRLQPFNPALARKTRLEALGPGCGRAT